MIGFDLWMPQGRELDSNKNKIAAKHFRRMQAI